MRTIFESYFQEAEDTREPTAIKIQKSADDIEITEPGDSWEFSANILSHWTVIKDALEKNLDLGTYLFRKVVLVILPIGKVETVGKEGKPKTSRYVNLWHVGNNAFDLCGLKDGAPPYFDAGGVGNKKNRPYSGG